MAMVVAVERGFITMEEALQRWEQVVGFLKTADRSTALLHWINGQTAKVIPFSAADNGGDLKRPSWCRVCSRCGSICCRKAAAETGLIGPHQHPLARVEWDWYTKGQNEAFVLALVAQQWVPDQPQDQRAQRRRRSFISWRLFAHPSY